MWGQLAQLRDRLRFAAIGLLGAGWPVATAQAGGEAARLGGADPQGPATSAVTALHHNPAMLAAMESSRAHLNLSAGLDQLWIRRSPTDPQSGSPTDGLEPATLLNNPGTGFFLGASFYFDPVAVGVGYYAVDSHYRISSSNALRYHLAPDPANATKSGGFCLVGGKNRCPPDGGSVYGWQDLTFAVAWNAGALQVGAAVHFPFVQSRFAYDEDRQLRQGSDLETADHCDEKEDPRCTERVGFKGWTHWVPRGTAAPGFDAALTFGLAYRFASDRMTLGLRYRTAPLRRSGKLVLSGVGLVCRPSDATQVEGDATDEVAPCDRASTIDAELVTRLPHELALGAAIVIGRAKLWRLDTNVFWLNQCLRDDATNCDTQTMRLVGLDKDSYVLPQFERFTGRQDVLGADVYGTYRARSNVVAMLGLHFNTPRTRLDALTPADGRGWTVGATAGSGIRLGQSDFVIIPGYGLDVFLPHRVRPRDAAFDPAARLAFEAAGGDINAPGADAVLEGRGRPTNAGRYLGLLHTFSLAVRWSERSVRFQ